MCTDKKMHFYINFSSQTKTVILHTLTFNKKLIPYTTCIKFIVVTNEVNFTKVQTEMHKYNLYFPYLANIAALKMKFYNTGRL